LETHKGVEAAGGVAGASTLTSKEVVGASATSATDATHYVVGVADCK
jgi:hypothetical protein